MIYSFLSCFQGPPLFPKLNFGLCARVFSAGFLSLEPTIDFFHWSAVFLHHVTSLSPRSLFSYWSAVSPSKPRDFPEPAILFTHWSAVSPSQKHVISGSGYDVIDLLSTNQEPGNLPYEPTLLLSIAVSGTGILGDFRWRSKFYGRRLRLHINESAQSYSANLVFYNDRVGTLRFSRALQTLPVHHHSIYAC